MTKLARLFCTKHGASHVQGAIVTVPLHWYRRGKFLFASVLLVVVRIQQEGCIETPPFRKIVKYRRLSIMPVKNEGTECKKHPEQEDDAEGKQDDCSDLTDHNHETDESTSKSFPQKVSSHTLF
jgi:hypothetical protein